MATKAARKSRPSRRVPEEQAGAVRLRKLILGVIDAQHRGDSKLRDEALEALGKFAGSDELGAYAADAQAAARNPLSADSVRLLSDIAARL